MSYKTEWDRIGYDLEDLYFEKLNRELIHKIKVQNDETDNHDELGHLIQFRTKSVVENPKMLPSWDKKAA